MSDLQNEKRKSAIALSYHRINANIFPFRFDKIFRMTVSGYELPISVTNMQKNITFLNKAALTILGKTRDVR